MVSSIYARVIFGKLMDYTGAAKSIARWLTKVLGAKRAILSVIVVCGVLTYGGISLLDKKGVTNETG